MKVELEIKSTSVLCSMRAIEILAGQLDYRHDQKTVQPFGVDDLDELCHLILVASSEVTECYKHDSDSVKCAISRLEGAISEIKRKFPKDI